MTLNVDNETHRQSDAPAPAHARGWAVAFRLSFWGLLGGLVGLNSWLAWESRPVPDLRAIAQLMSRESYGEAEKALRQHVRRSPHHGEARMMLARVLAARNDLAGSAAELHQVPFWWPSKPEALFREGQMQMALGRARLAEDAWRVCIANDPLHPTSPRFFTRAVHELIELYKWEDRRDDARHLIWLAIQQVDASAHESLLILSVWIELLRSDPEPAVAKLGRFVAADAADWEARLALARAQMAVGNADEATRNVEICLKARPGDSRAWREWLVILSKRGNDAELTSAITQLPESAQADPEIWMIRASARERTGDWAGAADAYRQSIRLRPWSDEAHYKLAIVEDRLGERAAADEHRKRHRDLRDARDQLRQAYDAYLDANQNASLTLRADLRSIYERLATSCTAVGLTREAEGWRRLSTKLGS
jgi:tetratricopeptide (TPR) repeat protein